MPLIGDSGCECAMAQAITSKASILVLRVQRVSSEVLTCASKFSDPKTSNALLTLGNWPSPECYVLLACYPRSLSTLSLQMDDYQSLLPQYQ